MIKAFLLLLEPVRTWNSVAHAHRSFGVVFLTYFLPMILLTAAAEGYGMVKFGKPQSAEYHGLRKFEVKEVVVYEALQAVLVVAIVLTCAQTLKSLGQTFHGRHTLTQAFTATAYGLSPLFLLRLLDMFPAVSPWVSWVIGIALSVAVLYHGVPRVMLPDPSHAFGLFVINSLQLILATGLLRFVTAWYLSGHFRPVDRLIAWLAGQLPF